jgi:hypothetical protein
LLSDLAAQLRRYGHADNLKIEVKDAQSERTIWPPTAIYDLERGIADGRI